MTDKEFQAIDKKLEGILAKLATEPDFHEGIYEGYRYRINRNKHLGFLLGYVGVDKNHPCYGKHYDDVDIDCHGGLTFAEPHYIPDAENLWWFGFDCGHAWDFAPYMYKRDMERLAALKGTMQRSLTYLTDLLNINSNSDWPIGERTTYKDFDYVKKECFDIIQQLKDIKDGKKEWKYKRDD